VKDPLINAIAFALESHAGQKDKAGKPYIFHTLRVADRVRAELPGDIDAQVAAILHDVMEDAGKSAADLVIAGFSGRVVELVRILSRLPNEAGKKKPYHLFVGDIRADGYPAIPIKLADLADNLDPDRLAQLPAPEAARLRAKYQEAIKILLS
jgi:(p)ppGpp synthase/HD superfamily hydrolase